MEGAAGVAEGGGVMDKFLDSLTQELIVMPDEQVLEGADVAQLQEKGGALLEFAKLEAERRKELGDAINQMRHGRNLDERN